MASLKKRNGTYYAQYYLDRKQKRTDLNTKSLQVAKEKLRQLESALARDEANPLPTRTPIGAALTKYVQDIRSHKTAKSVHSTAQCREQAMRVVSPSSSVPWRCSRWLEICVSLAFSCRCVLYCHGRPPWGQDKNVNGI